MHRTKNNNNKNKQTKKYKKQNHTYFQNKQTIKNIYIYKKPEKGGSSKKTKTINKTKTNKKKAREKS